MRHSYQSFVLSVLRRESAGWPGTSEAFSKFFLEKSREDGIQCLLFEIASVSGTLASWPETVRETLRQTVQNDATVEVWRQQNLAETIATLRQAGHEAVLLKGAALSLTHYSQPHLRTRTDTDLLVPPHSSVSIRTILESNDYECLSRITGKHINQEQVYKKMAGPVVCFYDMHFKLLTPLAFSDTLSYSEILNEARVCSLLGTQVSVMSERHALLHACMHRVAHHYEDPKWIWLYDIHLILMGKNAGWLDDFYRLAAEKRMLRICAVSLDRCRESLGTELPGEWLEKFRRAEGEPSAAFLNFQPNTITLFFQNLRAAPSLQTRRELIGEYFFPPPRYLKDKYHVSNNWLVPFLYLLRMITGTARIVRRLAPRRDRN